MKFAGEKTATQSSWEGSVCLSSTVTHWESSPCMKIHQTSPSHQLFKTQRCSFGETYDPATHMDMNTIDITPSWQTRESNNYLMHPAYVSYLSYQVEHTDLHVREMQIPDAQDTFFKERGLCFKLVGSISKLYVKSVYN